MINERITAAIVAGALVILLAASARGADLQVLSEPERERVYASVKVIGITPVLLENFRSGELTLGLPGGTDFTVDIPEDDRTVTVVLTLEPEDKPGFFDTAGKWILIGGVVGGLVGIAYLIATGEKVE